MDMVRHLQPDAGMPPRTVEHQHNLLGRTGTHGLSKGGELHFEERDTHAGGQMEDGAPGGGMDEADEPAPGEAVLHQGEWTRLNMG